MGLHIIRILVFAQNAVLRGVQEVELTKKQKKKKDREKEKKKKAEKKAGEEDKAAAPDQLGLEADARPTPDSFPQPLDAQPGPATAPADQKRVPLDLHPSSKQGDRLRPGTAGLVSDSPRPDAVMSPIAPTPPQVHATGAAEAGSPAESTPSPRGAGALGVEAATSLTEHDHASTKPGVLPESRRGSPTKKGNPPPRMPAVAGKPGAPSEPKVAGGSKDVDLPGSKAEPQAREPPPMRDGNPLKGGGVRSPTRQPTGLEAARRVSPPSAAWEIPGGSGKPPASKRTGAVEPAAQNGAKRVTPPQSLPGQGLAPTLAPKVVGQARRATPDNPRQGSGAGSLGGPAKAEDAGVDRVEKGRPRQRRTRKDKQGAGDLPGNPERDGASPTKGRRNVAPPKVQAPEPVKPPVARVPPWGRGGGQGATAAVPPAPAQASSPITILAPAGRQYRDAAKGTLSQAVGVDARAAPSEAAGPQPRRGPSPPPAAAPGMSNPTPTPDVLTNVSDPLQASVMSQLPLVPDPGNGRTQAGKSGQVCCVANPNYASSQDMTSGVHNVPLFPAVPAVVSHMAQ